MAYLKHKHNSRLVFDPKYPKIDESIFKDCHWKDSYVNAEEVIPPNAPKPRDKDFDLQAKVDSDHAGDKETIQSRTYFLIFCNMSWIDWLSKKQPKIETSVFGADFVVLKHVMEALRSIRCKLQMMGVPLYGCSYVYGDNMSIIHNTQRPESTQRKKPNSIWYHSVRESVAMVETKTVHISTHDNGSDLPTKVLYGANRKKFVGEILYDIYDYYFCLQGQIHCK